MKARSLCNDCHGDDFLGIECAWPAIDCLTSREAAAPRWKHRLVLAATAVLVATAAWQLGQAGYIHAKALLAQVLIKQAWAQTRAGAEPVRPWPWADTWPVARLAAPAHGTNLYVLAGADDRTIAFGPGHMFGTPLPGAAGNSVIGGHRDTHFAFLQRLDNGDEIAVHGANGESRRYRVAHMAVVDKEDLRVLAQPSTGSRLTLITCYPFDALRAGGPLRYVVTALPVENEQI